MPERGGQLMKCALVTGGARGIGRAIASALRDNGLQVSVVDTSEPVDSLPGVDFYRGAIGSAVDVANLAKDLEACSGIDILVNNAVIRGPTAPVTQYSLEACEAAVPVDLTE